MSRDVSKPPLVTVYIANHNYSRFIKQAIESVLQQTLTDFELIIIDDGSTDNSREIIEGYADHNNVITIFQQNKGLNVTNNIALRAARGRYIMRLDADDYLDINALTVMTTVLEQNIDIGMVFPDYFLVDEDGSVLEVVRRHNFDGVTLLDQPAHGACTLIRQQCLLELGGYDESYRCQDGYELWIRFIQRYRVKNINLPLFYYRQHPKSLTRDEENILATRAQIIEKRINHQGQHLSSIAIIPVRGRSTDPLSPALHTLGGLALIDWTLRPVLEAKRLSGVVVTTPDEELLAYITKNYGSRVMTVKRDRRLALPNIAIEDTIFHALGEYTRQHATPDVLLILYIESPFRTAQYIDNAVDMMELFDTDIVIAVRPDTDILYQHNGYGLQPLRKAQTLHLEREELYREVGSMRAVKREFLERQRQLVGGKTGHIIISQRAAMRLCSEWDWEIAEGQANKTDREATET
jgi:glycosyltransferase involved in cell wall biosynthesis